MSSRTSPEHAESIYVQTRGLLLYVATRKFKIPEGDAERIVHEAVLAFLCADTVIRNATAWLVAAACNGSRAYWRQRARADRVEGTLSEADHPADANAAERIARTVLVKSMLEKLSPSDRELLRLHYYEQLTAAEIAPLLGTTPGYVVKRISTALRRARATLTSMNRKPD